MQWILNQKFNIKGISHLLDDFFFVGKANTNDCFKALQTLLCLADILGVPIKAEKTQLPSTCITIYGIVSLLLRYKSKRSITLRELQSLLGLLNFACSVIIPARAFLRRLFGLTIGHTCPHYRITLNSEARQDLKLWLDFIIN